MAKVKTTEIDDQLSIVLNQTKESAETVKEANKIIDAFRREMAQISAQIDRKHESNINDIHRLIGANFTNFDNKIDEATNLLKAVNSTINQTKNQAIEEIKKVAENKMTYSKFTIWIASISAIMMVGFVGWIEIERKFDTGTIEDAKQSKINAEQLNANWNEWIDKNPKTKAAFNEWQEIAKKTPQK